MGNGFITCHREVASLILAEVVFMAKNDDGDAFVIGARRFIGAVMGKLNKSAPTNPPASTNQPRTTPSSRWL